MSGYRGLTDAEMDDLDDALAGDFSHGGTKRSADAVAKIKADAHAEVGNAFAAWAAKSEVSGVPLDWAWFGEILRRYSPRHEHYVAPDAVPSGEATDDDIHDPDCTCGLPVGHDGECR